MESTWVSYIRCEEAWEFLRDLPGGGQGAAKLGRLRSGEGTAFIKLLSRPNDAERRARFFREATAYDTCKHAGIPRLIQSNAHLHHDAQRKLYIATEYVPGGTLNQHISSVGNLTLQAALRMLQGLLDIVSYLHREGWVHRDIKPQNIILRNDDSGSPVLVDFGLGHKDGLAVSFETELGQEIGNRFLRLPELSSGSTSKSDPRSDVAFLGGVLFYALTGSPPSTLLDAEGRMPHQRLAPTLRTASGDAFLNLQDFFDRTFSQRLSGRFASADEMNNYVSRLKAPQRKGSQLSSDEELAAIAARLNSDSNRELVALKSKYDLAMNVIREVHAQIAKSVAPTFQQFWSSHVNFTEGLTNTLGFNHFATLDHRFAPVFRISAIGEELVITVDGARSTEQKSTLPNSTRRFESRLNECILLVSVNLPKRPSLQQWATGRNIVVPPRAR